MKKNKKANVKNQRNIIIVIAIIVVLIIYGVVLSKVVFKKKQTVVAPKVVDSFNDYELKDNATTYHKNLFGELKKIYTTDPINEEEYAKKITQLYLSDLFNLNNKVNKNDVGGVQFVYKPFQNDVILLTRESLYNHVENDIYGGRKQELPIVHSVEIISIKTDKFKYLDKIDKEAYYVDASISYEKDLGYQKKATVIIIHNDDKLEIAEIKQK